MKRSLVREVLEHLALCGGTLMLDAFFTPHGQGLGRSIRSTERLAMSCSHDFSLRSRATLSTTLSRLKRQGKVTRNGSKKRALWRITREGKSHFVVRKNSMLPIEDGKIRLVIFDVPERERKKRDWLRARLLTCDYSLLQKSVWMGTRPLPRDLKGDLRDMGLTFYVRIMALEGR